MPNTVLPAQLGTVPFNPGGSGSASNSQIVMGRDPTVTFEAVGLGAQGRPDYLQTVKINFSKAPSGSNTYKQMGSVSFDVADVYSFFTGNLNVPQNLNIKFRQVSVCEVNDTTQETEERAMIILASQTFATGQGSAGRAF